MSQQSTTTLAASVASGIGCAEIGAGYRGKRCFDVVMSLVLIILTFGILVLALFAVWLTSGQPFFWQPRIGRYGKPFIIWKIRTMEDHKPTRIGKILRAVCIDELPQLFQVLWGTMSIVGPRPHVRDEVRELMRMNSRYREVLQRKPGLVSPVCVKDKWQLLCKTDPNFDPVQIQLDYFKNESWESNLQLVAQTALKISKGVGSLFGFATTE